MRKPIIPVIPPATATGESKFDEAGASCVGQRLRLFTPLVRSDLSVKDAPVMEHELDKIFRPVGVLDDQVGVVLWVGHEDVEGLDQLFNPFFSSHALIVQQC
jgi:hypothetical protein